MVSASSLRAGRASQVALPDGLTVLDPHPGNLILMRDGTMVPINLHVHKCPPEALPEELRTQKHAQS